MQIDEDAQFVLALLIGLACIVLCIGIAFSLNHKQEPNHAKTTNQVEKP